MDLRGKPLIQHVYDNCAATGIFTGVAIPHTPGNEDLHKYLKENDIPYYRGSVNNVALRYLMAASYFNLRHIIRVTGDCPLINTDVILELFNYYNSHKVEYASNLIPRTYPKGWDCEMFNIDQLLRAVKEGTAEEKEHVTPRIIKNCIKDNSIGGIFQSVNDSAINLSVDYLEDLERLRALGLNPS